MASSEKNDINAVVEAALDDMLRNEGDADVQAEVCGRIWFSSSKLVLKTVETCCESLNYYENGSIIVTTLSGHRFYCFQQKQNNFNKHLQL
jgi:hypothetical protein